MNTIGNNIKKRRLELNMTQKDLSLGICTQSQISKIEKNEIMPLANLLISISKRLDISLDELVNGNHNGTNNKLDQNLIQKLLIQRDYKKLNEYLDNIDQKNFYHEDTVYLTYLKLVIQNALYNKDVLLDLLKLYDLEKDNLSPGLNVNILNSIGNFLVQNKEFKDAQKFFEKAIADIFSYNLECEFSFKIIYNHIRIFFYTHDYKDMYESSQDAINLSINRNNFVALPEYIYSKNFALKKLDSANLIDKEELSFAKYLAKKQKKIEILNLLKKL